MGAEARRSLYEYCRLNQKQYLLDEWDDGRNLPLTPQTITYGSKRAAWWRCANGHTWRAVLYTRTGGALSLLHGAKGAARLQRSGVGPPGAGAAVGLREKRAARPGGYQRRKREIRLVAVRKGAQLAGAHPVPHGGLRLPGLCRKTAPARRKRPRVGLSGACKAVGRCAKRESAPAGRAAGDGEKSLVDMRTRPPLARSNLDAHTQPERLPGLRREAGPAGLQ